MKWYYVHHCGQWLQIDDEEQDHFFDRSPLAEKGQILLQTVCPNEGCGELILIKTKKELKAESDILKVHTKTTILL